MVSLVCVLYYCLKLICADAFLICSDDDLAHFAQQRKMTDAVADAWKKADLVIKAQEHEAEQLKAIIR